MKDERLNSLLAGPACLTTGVYDPLSAKLAEQAGFSAAMLSGYSVAATYLGEPDFGILTQSEILDVARRTVRSVAMPILVDGDTGHGGALNVMRMVRELVAMGAAGIFLEDQCWPKRCGHMRDKTVVAAEEHVEKLRAAVEARNGADLIIVGRTDARAPLGLEEAIGRGNAYRDAGADLVFVEAPDSEEELKTIRAEIPGPLLLNIVEGGHTPLLSRQRVAELGFEVVVYPLTGLLASARALQRAYTQLARDGESTALNNDMMGFDEFGELLGLNEAYATDTRFKSSTKNIR